MIVRSYIEKNLLHMDRLYNRSPSVQEGLYFSKLAILELCGWIEISMDDIVRRLAKRLIKIPSHVQYIEKEIIRRTYGFEYERHFKRMIISVIGLHGIDRMEKKVNPMVFQPMCAALDALKPYRDKHAHEYIKGTTLRLDAPSVTMGRFRVVYSGLIDVDSVLKQFR